MKKYRSRRSKRNIILFVLSFVYVFLVGLIDDETTRGYVYSLTSAGIYFSAVLVIVDKKYTYFVIALVLAVFDTVSLFMNLNLMSDVASFLSFSFFIFVIISLVIRIAKSKSVGALEFLEAVNIYFLFGIIGSILCRIIYSHNPQSFNFSTESIRQTADFLYYSFVTLTTLGYGDITPHSPLAKALSNFLSFAGQLYLAMIIALLVGKYLSQSPDISHDVKK